METHELIEASLQTDQGRIRDHNEDYVTFWEPDNEAAEVQNGWLYIVADGVGGADAGEVELLGLPLRQQPLLSGTRWPWGS